jgi:hypothetical protein
MLIIAVLLKPVEIRAALSRTCPGLAACHSAAPEVFISTRPVIDRIAAAAFCDAVCAPSKAAPINKTQAIPAFFMAASIA